MDAPEGDAVLLPVRALPEAAAGTLSLPSLAWTCRPAATQSGGAREAAEKMASGTGVLELSSHPASSDSFMLVARHQK